MEGIKMKISRYTYNQFVSPEFKAPSKFYYKDSFGNYIFMHTRSFVRAKEYVDNKHGKGFFVVRRYSTPKSTKQITAR